MKNLKKYLLVVGQKTQKKMADELKELFDSGAPYAIANKKIEDISKNFTGRTLKKEYKNLDIKETRRIFIEETIKEYRGQASEPLTEEELETSKEIEFFEDNYNSELDIFLSGDDSAKDKEAIKKAKEKGIFEDTEDIEKDDIKRTVVELLKLDMVDEVDIEIIGSWIWVVGPTLPYKSDIANLGLRWSPKRKAWYYFDGIQESKRRKGSSKLDMQELRDKYKARA